MEWRLYQHRILPAAIALIAAGGIILRFWSLPSLPLTTTELQYHYAAQSLAQTGEPTLPSGDRYGTGLSMVRVIAAVQRPWMEAETAARLPSALTGSVVLLVVVGFAWLVAGPWAALVAGFLVAFYPEAIRQSRTAGLYSAQMLLGVVAMAAGWLATARSGPQQSSSDLDLLRRWSWASLAVVAFLLAGMAHRNAATVLVGFGAWTLLLALVSLWVSGPRAVRRNLAMQLVLLGVLLGIAVVVARPGIIGAVIAKITSPALAPVANDLGGSGITFYLQKFAAEFGWAFSLLPLLALLTVRKHPWLTVYLLMWFVVPFVIHSLFIFRKEERFLLMATPALFVLAGLAVTEAREILIRAVNLHTRDWLTTYRSAVNTASATAALAVVTALLTLPAFHQSLTLAAGANTVTHVQWGMLRSIVTSQPALQNIPLGSTDPLATLKYVGRADFGVSTSLEPIVTPGANYPQGRHSIIPSGNEFQIERSSGAILARDPDILRGIYPSRGEVLIVARNVDFERGVFTPEMLTELRRSGVDLCAGRCGNLRLFRLYVADIY